MNPETLNAISTALRQHAAATAAANAQLMAALKAIPGGEDLLRRNLAECGLDSAQIDSILAGQLPGSALPGLLNLGTPKN